MTLLCHNRYRLTRITNFNWWWYIIQIRSKDTGCSHDVFIKICYFGALKTVVCDLVYCEEEGNTNFEIT